MRSISRPIPLLGGICVFLLIVSGTSVAQATQQTPASEAAWITGRVLAKASGAPVVEAVVMIAGRSVNTDADGRFSLGPLPPGRWRLSVRKQGYLLAGLDGKPANPALYSGEGGIYFRLDTGARISVDLYLLAGGTVSGVVLSDRGAPRLGARVMALSRYYDERGILQIRPVAFESTNDLGQFRLFGLMPGTYLMRAGDSALTTRSTTDDILLPRYYPGVDIERIDAAEAIVVDGLSEVRLNPIVVPTVKPRKLRVHAMDESGAPVTAIAGIQARRAGMTYTLMMDFSGTFTVGPGQYEIGVTTATDIIAPTVSPVSRSATAATGVVAVGEQDTDFNLVVRRSARVTGRVSDHVAGVQIRFNPLGWPLPPLGAVSAADGTFDVPGIPAGAYSVIVAVRGRDYDGSYVTESDNLSFPAGKCIAFLSEGDRDLLVHPLQVNTQNVEITVGLRDESARVRGTVRKPDGDVAPGAVVALVPDDRSRSADFFSTTTDQDGRFEFRCGQPGRFHLYAWPRLPGFAYRNADFMKEYDDRGTPVTLETNVDKTVVVPLFDTQ